MKVYDVTIKAVLVVEDDAPDPTNGDFSALLKCVGENADRSEVFASELKRSGERGINYVERRDDEPGCTSCGNVLCKTGQCSQCNDWHWDCEGCSR